MSEDIEAGRRAAIAAGLDTKIFIKPEKLSARRKWTRLERCLLFLGNYVRARRYGNRRESAKIAWALTENFHKGDPRRYALVEKFKTTGRV